jgi:hypothetical protein
VGLGPGETTPWLIQGLHTVCGALLLLTDSAGSLLDGWIEDSKPRSGAAWDGTQCFQGSAGMALAAKTSTLMWKLTAWCQGGARRQGPNGASALAC